MFLVQPVSRTPIGTPGVGRVDEGVDRLVLVVLGVVHVWTILVPNPP